ncbi:hypothetical protein H310_00007 [Aphanomyces invadans]|uniref:Protein-tyrosine-phosphatase n=1 Tax=Aphanomyces invadans TaxID=157072 RepID=A0A024USV2_9STRA|nr:hypothetical protein H310_00007 [Aphanomyces invadans]ETW09394.1 hypothetical protein H310_00007 [Aphanomyces invadans]|eukprot:XP_008860805.1 hypothetical protein H310_00007 [Aphanomyces invadans]
MNVPKENPEEGTFNAFDEAAAYIEDALKAHKRVLVHSTYGRSRCCTLVVYFIMKAERVPLVEAYHRVLLGRPQMMPRDAILDILLQKERLLYGTSCFDEPYAEEEYRARLKHLVRGGLLTSEGQAQLTAAISNIHDMEVRQLAAKNKTQSVEAATSTAARQDEFSTSNSSSKRTVPESSVTCRWLFNRLQSGTGMLLLDARSRVDFDDDCIPTAISTPAPTNPSMETLDGVQKSLLPEQTHLFSAKKRKLREVVIYGYAVKVTLKEISTKSKPWLYVLGGLLVAEGLVTSVRYMDDGFTTFQFRYPFYTSRFLFNSLTNDDENGHLLARTQSGTHNVNYPNEILDSFLFLGNMWHAQSPSVIRNLGITHIVNASLDTNNVFDEAGVAYHEVKIKDDIHANIAAHFEPTFRFIEAAKQVQHSRVLIHCTQGISRSCTLAIYYVMRAQRWSLVTSVNYCISNRGVCFPNQGFLQALMVEERKLYLANSLSTHELDLLLGNSLPDRPVPKPAPMDMTALKPEICQTCNKLFSFFDWRHRCGLCKRTVCSKCSSSRLILSDGLQVLDRADVGRVCDRCVVHLWSIHLPLPFRLNFNFFSDKYADRTRRTLTVKSPSLQHQSLMVSYIPGTEAQVLMNILRKRFQVREYELLDVTGDGIGLDSAWNLMPGRVLDLPDDAVLFACIGESGSIPLTQHRSNSYRGRPLASGNALSRQRMLHPEHSYSSRSLPSNNRQPAQRSRSFSEGRALALQESLRERERSKHLEHLQHSNVQSPIDKAHVLVNTSSNAPAGTIARINPTSIVDENRFTEMWRIAFPGCSVIPRDVLLGLDNDVLMELMLGIAFVTTKFRAHVPDATGPSKSVVLETLFRELTMSPTTSRIMHEYMEF